MPNGDGTKKVGAWAPLLVYLIGTLVAGIWNAAKVDSRLEVLEAKVMDPTHITAMQKDMEQLRRDHTSMRESLRDGIINTLERVMEKHIDK